MAIYNFNPRKGGAERYGYDLATRLVSRGHEVYVFCTNGVEIQGVKLVKVNATPYPRWLRTLTFALSHRSILKTFPVDVMLGFGNTLEADVYQSHGGVQRIWMEREIASYDRGSERAYKAFLLKNSINQRVQEWIAEYPIRRKSCSRIVAISDMVKNHMAAHYNLDPASIVVVYNGVDTERFHPAARKSGGPLRILFSAGNFRLKGLLPLLLSLGEVVKERKDFQLSVMGRGRRERYQRAIMDLKIGACVSFLGEQSSPENVYRESHILAHPTFYDACSLTTMESMASGLPTITTRWNGASALISEKEGYVIDEPSDIGQLAQAINSLFDEEFRNRMGAQARLKIESFTMNRNAGEMERVLTEAASGR